MQGPIRGRVSRYKYEAQEIFGRFLEYRKIAKLRDQGEKRESILSLLERIREESELLLNAGEAYTLYMCVNSTSKIPGDIAEVGVYRGGSARIICEVKGDRPLHLFDTFEGIPVIDSEKDGNTFQQGQYAASLEEVQQFLRGYENVHFYKGIFPATGKAVKEQRFSLVNLDVDVYRSTRAGLRFFYPRMTPGGIILSHDYCESTPGVKRAFDEFFSNKPEPIIEMPGYQCLVVKLGGHYRSQKS
ncbi:MAG: TylF/MycF family methyltransferase [Methanomicrobiales archaeon]|nr:TylF/MycF family methyltransferase [Methanomicrobiales archaeon]